MSLIIVIILIMFFNNIIDSICSKKLLKHGASTITKINLFQHYALIFACILAIFLGGVGGFFLYKFEEIKIQWYADERIELIQQLEDTNRDKSLLAEIEEYNSFVRDGQYAKTQFLGVLTPNSINDLKPINYNVNIIKEEYT